LGGIFTATATRLGCQKSLVHYTQARSRGIKFLIS
jgi:hypothetical protein